MLSVRASAQSDTIRSNRVITNVQMIGLGYTNILDTYLSPEEYTGEEIRYISHTTREKEGSHLSQQIVHCGNMAYTNSMDTITTGNFSEEGFSSRRVP